ncbi:hypothetical protein H5410_019352 [Solanum commersonii]|uniref:Uncharacterized protein n=1 Tax=Solanum commersonii TaxID=4109 RepID=A0A9J5Z836_SOLCO|nr:hypothetical protein H5410_019352 [Solanum commersonii]
MFDGLGGSWIFPNDWVRDFRFYCFNFMLCCFLSECKATFLKPLYGFSYTFPIMKMSSNTLFEDMKGLDFMILLYSNFGGSFYELMN